jgi:hypothetical protein
MYLYRIDDHKGLKEIKDDGYLRARMWTPKSFPHKKLKEIHDR